MKRIIVISVIGVMLLIGLAVWLMESASPTKKDNKNYYSNWQNRYELDDNNPRGISFFKELLQTYTNDTVYNLTKWNDLKTIPNYQHANYLFIGNQYGMSNQEFDSLSHLVDSGATLLLSFNDLTSNIYQRFFYDNAYDWEYNKQLFVYFTDSTYRFNAIQQNDTIYNDWFVFRNDRIIDSNFHAYMYALKQPSAFFVNQAKGKIHFHSLPQLFENVQVLKPNGYVHALTVLSQLQRNKPTIFLTCGDFEKQQTYGNEGDGNKEDQSLLQFILQNKALRIAFLLSILLLLLYVIFRAKRKENIVPGHPKKQNRSLPYVETLASIYISKNSPIDVLQLIRKNFFAAIQRYFYVDLSKEETRKDALKHLKERIPHAANQLDEIVNGLVSRKIDVTDAHLAKIQAAIHTFYIENGVIQNKTQFTSSNRLVSIEKSLLLGSTGVLLGMLIGIRGMAYLTGGFGIGIVLVIIAMAIIFLSVRFLAKPLLVIHKEHMVLHGIFFGKKEISLNQTITCILTETSIQFDCEDGTSFKLKRLLLAKHSKVALKQFVEYLKLKS